MSIADILTEPLIARGDLDRAGATARVRELLDQVAMPTDAEDRYPSEFSGGQRQRIAIARALALDPTLIVCDEPVSALDLSTQGRVLDLLVGIQRRTGVAYLFVSHDLSVVRHISHRVAVLRRGRIVELATAIRSHRDQATTTPANCCSPPPCQIRKSRRNAGRSGSGCSRRPNNPERDALRDVEHSRSHGAAGSFQRKHEKCPPPTMP